MFLPLDGDGPLHRQLTRAMKEAVAAGRLAPGARLPASRELAADMGLARNTVRTAYDQLMAEGVLETRVGAGTFVTEAARGRPRRAPAESIAAPSRFAARVRGIEDFGVGALHRGLRFNLQYGEPLHDPAAISAWRRELAHAALHTSPGYPAAHGLPALREAVCDYLARRRGLAADPGDVVIVHGTQQALSLAAQVLVDPGETVVIEEPHYFSARQVFVAHGAKVAAVDTDREGLVTAKLPRAGAKLVFVTPSHQFPGGSLMSLARRRALLEYAHRHRAWVFEDDYDSEFRYDGAPLPALAALDAADGGGRVVYAGSFSKVMFPSLRLGYLVVPRALRRDMVLAKRLADMGSPAIEQAAMARFIAGGGFERHLRRVVQIAKRRRRALLEGLAAVGPGVFAIDDTRAGMHLVAWLPGHTHAEAARLVTRAAARGVGLHPIAPLYRRPPATPGLLLGFAALSEIEIAAAMKELAVVLRMPK